MAKGAIKVEIKERDGHADWDAISKMLNETEGQVLAEWELDMTRLSFIDSLGLGNLIALNGRLNQRNSKLEILTGKNSAVTRLLYAARIDRLITITEK